ncbi:DUF6234 family protein [Streptomyces mesophilus]|uniref:DUF6234 family protein n=1 Tax=Streptomyces mesophilus TaxID=1775132 RepID=UPI00331CB2E8
MPAQNPRGGGCFDGLFALLMAVADIAALVAAGLMLGLRGWAQSSQGGERASAAPSDPPMDWTPAVWFGVVFAVMVLLAYACWTGGLRITGGVQAAFAVLAGILLSVVLAQEYDRSHPEPAAPAPSSTYHGSYSQCRSGGDSHECLGG